MAKYNPDSPVTNKTLNEAVDAILNGVEEMVKDLKKEDAMIRQEIAEFREENAGQHSHMKDDINYIKAQISTTPSREEFENVKARLQKLEKLMLRN